MKKRDFILIGGVVFAALLILAYYIIFVSAPGVYVQVSINGETVETFSLDTDLDYVIQSEDGGENHLIIKDGKAYVTEANCRDHICVRAGGIDTAGEQIVCLPHKVIVEIIGE